jgi:hypothetical protein
MYRGGTPLADSAFMKNAILLYADGFVISRRMRSST